MIVIEIKAENEDSSTCINNSINLICEGVESNYFYVLIESPIISEPSSRSLFMFTCIHF